MRSQSFSAAAIPAWLAAWVDPTGWAALQQAVAGTLTTVSASLPMLGTAVGWLVPVVWIVWGLGLAVMLMLAALAHWLIGRLNDRYNSRTPAGPSPVPV